MYNDLWKTGVAACLVELSAHAQRCTGPNWCDDRVTSCTLRRGVTNHLVYFSGVSSFNLFQHCNVNWRCALFLSHLVKFIVMFDLQIGGLWGFGHMCTRAVLQRALNFAIVHVESPSLNLTATLSTVRTFSKYVACFLLEQPLPLDHYKVQLRKLDS